MATLADRKDPPQILVVDDNRGDSLLLRLAFEDAKLAAVVTLAASAEDALSLLRREGKQKKTARPDLILLDINLPHMSGLAMLNVIKNDPKISAIPVIILSSSIAERDVAASYAGHANGYVIKPTNLAGYGDLMVGLEKYWFKLVHTPPASLQ